MNKLALSINGDTINGAGGAPTGGTLELGALLRLGVNYFLLFALITFVIMLVWFGVSWVTSGGDKQALQKIRTRFWYILVGIVIVLMSFAIISFMETLFGVNSGLTTP